MPVLSKCHDIIHRPFSTNAKRGTTMVEEPFVKQISERNENLNGARFCDFDRVIKRNRMHLGNSRNETTFIAFSIFLIF